MVDKDDMVQNDAKKVKRGIRQYRSGSFSPSVAQLLEQTMWALSVTSLVLMIVVLPWVGTDKLIPGVMWIGLGCSGIVLFGLCALLVRAISHSFEDADRAMSNKFERGR